MTPDQAAYWRDQGIAAARGGDRAGANAALGRAVQLDPTDADSWFWLAAVQTDPRHALLALERTLALNPHHERALAGRSAIRAQLGLDTSAPPVAPVALAPAAPPQEALNASAAPSPFSSVPAPSPFSAAVASAPATPVYSPFGPPAASPFGPPPPASAPGANTLYGGIPETGAAPAGAGEPARADALADLAQRGIAAARAGRVAEARAALLEYVERDERNEEVWFWLSRILDDPRDVEVALENVLELNPGHTEAAQALEALHGQEEPAGGGAPAQAGEPESDEEDMGAFGPPPAPDELPSNALARRAMLDPTAPHAWAGVPVAAAPSVEAIQAYEHAELVGQVLARRYRIVSLFPSQGSTLLLALDIRNGHYLLLKPDSDKGGHSTRNVRPAFVHDGTGFAISSIGLGGISLRHFLGAIGRMPPQQAVDYGLRLIREAGRGKRPLLERRSWSPDKIVIDPDGALDLSAPDRRDETDLPSPATLSPPEHTAGEPLDERSDVYLVGALVYYLATGAPPPPANQIPTPRSDTQSGAGRRDAKRSVAVFSTAPDLPSYLAGALATALQPDPAVRYQTLAEFAGVLDQLSEELRKTPRSARGGGGGLTSFLTRVVVIVVLLFLVFLAAVLTNSLPQVLGFTLRSVPPTQGASASSPPAAARPPASRPPAGRPAPAGIFSVGGVTETTRLAISHADVHAAPVITLYVSITAGDQKPVGGLTKDNFQVTSDGAPVPDFSVENLSTTTETVATLLLVDVSNSMSGQPLQEAKTAADEFVQLFAPGDKMGLVAFHDKPQLLQDLTITHTLVLSQIDALDAFGNTALYDALYLAADKASKESGATDLVLLSDGKDTSSASYTRDDVVQFCRLQGIPIYVIGLNHSADYDHDALFDLATHTGGQLLESPDPLQLVDLYRRLAYQIQGQYRVTIHGPAAAGNHKISVALQGGTQVYSDTTTYLIK